MKKILFLLLFIFVVSFSTNVSADTEQSSLLLPPERGNYFNPENFKIEDHLCQNIYKIRVKPNTSYRFIAYEGHCETEDMTTHLIEEGISLKQVVTIKTKSLDISKYFVVQQKLSSGAVVYVDFVTGNEDYYIEKITFPIPDEYVENGLPIDYKFSIIDCYFDLHYAERLEPYVDPMPIDEEIIYEQAIHEGIYYINYDNMPTQEEIKNTLTATDNVDGNITEDITLESGLYYNKPSVGDYKMLYAVKDKAGNRSEFTVTLRVVDITSPKIVGPGNLIVNMGNSYDADFYMSLLSVYDNYDQNPTIKLKSSNLNNVTPGTYTLVFEATDSSENISTYTLYVRVYDNYAPVITANSVILSTTTNEPISLNDIRRTVAAKASCDESDLKVLYDNYSNYESIAGEYRLEFLYSDGNEMQSETVKINVLGNEKKNPIETETIIITAIGVLGVLGVSGYFVFKKVKKIKMS